MLVCVVIVCDTHEINSSPDLSSLLLLSDMFNHLISVRYPSALPLSLLLLPLPLQSAPSGQAFFNI